MQSQSRVPVVSVPKAISDPELDAIVRDIYKSPPGTTSLDELITLSLLESAVGGIVERRQREWQAEALLPSVLAAAIVGGLLVFLAMKRLSVPLWLAAFLTALRRRAWMLCRVVGAGLLVVGMLGVYAASRADESFEWWAVAAGVGAGMVATTLPMRATN
ncbi:MAG: hypothetical protein ACK5ZG_14320 [Phycisphaerae bacterium]